MALSINSNALHVYGMTHFDLALHVRLLGTLMYVQIDKTKTVMSPTL